MDSVFAKEIAKQAVARAAVALSIDQIDKMALDALADVLRLFITTVGESSKDLAEVGGRPFPGIQDAIKALEGMVCRLLLVCKYSTLIDLSNSQRPKSIQWPDLKSFGLDDDEIEGEDDEDDDQEAKQKRWCQPFPFEVRPFPLDLPLAESIDTGLLVDSSSAARDSFIPSHLPPYPPSYTFRRATKKRSAGHLDKALGGSDGREKRLAVAKSAKQSLAKLEDAVDNVD